MTGDQVTIHRDSAFTLTSNAPAIARAFARAPARTFWHVRDLMGQVFGSHRKAWLAETRVRFHRGGMQATQIAAEPKGRGWAGRLFFYRVSPASKSPPNPKLEDIEGEVYTSSPAAELLEGGGTVRPRKGRQLAIPIGVTLRSDGRPVPAWSTPARYRKAKAGNDLVALDLGDGPLLYQKRRGVAAARKSGAVSRTSERGKRVRERTVLVPAYSLHTSTAHKPILRFYGVWDRLEADRTRRVASMMSSLLAEVARRG